MSIEVPAREVVIGDRIASRNICGGLMDWRTVTEPLAPKGRGITCAHGALYVCRDPDEMVEIHEGRPAAARLLDEAYSAKG